MAQDADGNYLVNGQKVLIPFIYKSTDNMMIQMLKQRSAGYSTELGEIQIFNDTTAEILYTVAEHAATGAFNTFKLTGYPANFLNAGQCIFAIDSTAGATWMGSNAPLVDIAEEKLVQFETQVMTIPQLAEVDFDGHKLAFKIDLIHAGSQNQTGQLLGKCLVVAGGKVGKVNLGCHGGTSKICFFFQFTLYILR